MATSEEYGESLGDLEELLGCVADLETEDVVYLEEYLAGDWEGGSPGSLNPPSPLQPPPCSVSSFWSTWEEEEEEEGVGSLESLPRVILEEEEEKRGSQVSLAETGDQNDPDLTRSGSGSSRMRVVRSNRGVAQTKFVSYVAFPPTKGRGSVCEVCGVRLSTREGRRRHILSRHVKERTNACDVCGKAFIFKFALKTHQAVHASSPSHVCVCGASFSLRASYMDHVRRIHQAATATHTCHLCFKTFHDRHTLRVHLISVHMPKTIACLHPGCPKVFSTIGLMRSHYRYHLKQRFVCDDCGQSFSTESYMYKHRLTHLGIRPHACLDCGQTYLSVSHLNKHRKIAHSTLKPYQCSVCGKCYKTRDHLTFHESNHRGEKPYKCEVCGYMTAYRNTYYAHKKKNHSTSATTSAQTTGQQTTKNTSTHADRKEKNSVHAKMKGKGKVKRKKNIELENAKVVDTNEKQPDLNTVLPQILNYSAEETVSCGRVEVSEGSRDGGSVTEEAASVNLFCVVSSEVSNSAGLNPELPLVEQPISENLNCAPHIDDTQHPASFVSHSTVLQSQVVPHENRKIETPSIIQNDKLELLRLLTNTELPSETGRTPEKQDSLIILSSVGKCAVPNCDNNDDSLLLFKADANSYVGLCGQHAIIDSQENDSEINNKLLETEDLSTQSQPVSSPKESKICEISIIADRSPSELFMEYSPPQATRDLHPLVTLTVKYEKTGAESETLLQQQEQQSTSVEFTEKYEKSEVHDGSLIKQHSHSALVGKYEKTESRVDSLLQIPSLSQPPSDMPPTSLTVSTNSLPPSQPTETCLDETFSTMMELDSGVPSLSGHIVDDSFNLAQLEVQCPICDQFLCMDAYVTHLECSHN